MRKVEVLDHTFDRAEYKLCKFVFSLGREHTYLRSSSSAVQKRQAQYTLIVNAMAEVIQTPAKPASTYPDRANSVVVRTARAPRASN